MKITFLFSRLSTSALLNYSSTYQDIIEQVQLEDEDSKILQVKLNKVLRFYQDLLNRAHNEILTTRIAQANKALDYSFVVFRDGVDREKKRHMDAFHADADLLMEAIRLQGYSLQYFGYTAQEEALTQLINAFDTDTRLVNAIKALKLEADFEDMKNKFETFQNLRRQRRENKLGKAENKSLKTVRQELINTIRLWNNYIALRTDLHPEDQKMALLPDKIVKLNKSFRSLLKAQETRRTNSLANSSPSAVDIEDADSAALKAEMQSNTQNKIKESAAKAKAAVLNGTGE